MASPRAKIFKSSRLVLISGLALILSACLSADIEEIVQRQCPSVAILNTADILMVEGAKVEIDKAALKCFINREKDDELLAAVTLSGRATARQQVPLFLAALDEKDAVISRTQYQVQMSSGVFTLTLPSIAYGKKGAAQTPRLVAGFVLTPDQLTANRAAYRQKLGLGD